jgi:hypothetical protein
VRRPVLTTRDIEHLRHVMTKGRRTILVVATVLLLSVVAYSAVTVLFPTRRLALTAFHGPRGNAVFGLPLVEPTFENHVIWLSSNIIVGTIVTTPPEGRVQQQGIFEVRVKEDIISRTEDDMSRRPQWSSTAPCQSCGARFRSSISGPRVQLPFSDKAVHSRSSPGK